jgi:hypothetical protein
MRFSINLQSRKDQVGSFGGEETVTPQKRKMVCWAPDLTTIKPIPARGSMFWALGDEDLGEDGDETEMELEEE